MLSIIICGGGSGRSRRRSQRRRLGWVGCRGSGSHGGKLRCSDNADDGIAIAIIIVDAVIRGGGGGGGWHSLFLVAEFDEFMGRTCFGGEGVPRISEVTVGQTKSPDDMLVL